MALLIATELLTLYFAMSTLSAVRAFVGGEGLWSKAQKNSVLYLQKYVTSKDERHYRLFEGELAVPLGDRMARIEIEKPDMNMNVVMTGFQQGLIHPADIPEMVKLVRRFHKVPHLARALEKWNQGDQLVSEYIDLASQLHDEIRKKESSEAQISKMMNQVFELDARLTRVENEFSFALGEASRWLENILMLTLIFAVVTVECTGLFLTFSFGNRLKNVLGEMIVATNAVSEGNFKYTVPVHSKDELGQLAISLNRMISNLQQQIHDRETAQQASQAKNLFLANMSHEIRTPLNAVLGFSELLQDSNLTDEERQTYGSIIRRTGNSLTTIINDILDVAKVEAEQLKIEMAAFSFTQLMDDVYTLMRLRCDEKSIDLIFEKNGEISDFIFSDPVRIRQILVNMIGNAIKFTQRGSVTVKYQVLNGYLDFRIIDTGVGIPEAQTTQLFKPFSQGDSSVRKQFGGTGLGLVISQKLARLLEGDAGLSETHLGVGTEFFVRVKYIPQTPENAKVVADQVAKADLDESRLKDKKILVVEDSLDNQIIAQLFLRKSGVFADFASNGLEGVTKATENAYDLILMDIQMPVMDGYAATAILREKGLTIPIVALTGYAMKEDQQRCLSVGCNDFVSKPYDRAKLIKCILKNLS